VTKRELKKVLRLLRKIVDIMGPSSGKCLHGLGKQAEIEFEKMANERGFTTESHANRSLAYDLVVNGRMVQVKHRKKLASGCVTLCGNRRYGASRMAYLIGEFDVLALRCEGKWYLIPEAILRSGNGETLINTIRPEQYEEYVDNWGVFSEAGVLRNPNQMRLEFQQQ
jgi:hypothetical protein